MRIPISPHWPEQPEAIAEGFVNNTDNVRYNRGAVREARVAAVPSSARQNDVDLAGLLLRVAEERRL